MTLKLEHYQHYDNKYSKDVINAEIVLDSIYPVRDGQRLTTMLLTIPQIIHAELLRHRVFNFAVSSNRAVPFKTILKNNNFYPVWRSKNVRGMQPGSFIEVEKDLNDLDAEWEYIRQEAINSADYLDANNVAKEITNRLLFPFQTINILIAGTSFQNFFNLRNHPDAQFEIQVLARRMQEVYENSAPQPLLRGEWHLPFIRENEKNNPLHEKLAVSTARCARTSYRMPSTDKISEFDADIKLFKQLSTPPLHASPLEFVATPMTIDEIYGAEMPKGVTSILYGNTYGFIQLRSFFDKQQYLTDTFNNTYQEIVHLRELLNDGKQI